VANLSPGGWLWRAIYDSLIASGMPPNEAGYLASKTLENSSFNTATVENYINQAWSEIPANLPLDQRILFAWAILTAMRGNMEPYNELTDLNPTFAGLKLPIPKVSNPEDLDLAYAQHYMLARLVAARTGDVGGMKAAARLYNTYKDIMIHEGLTGTLKTDPKHNTSAPTPESEMWASAGALQGGSDFRQQHPGQTPGSAIGLLTAAKIIQVSQLPKALLALAKLLNSINVDKIITDLESFAPQAVESVATFCQQSAGADLNVAGTVLSSPAQSPPAAKP
jgi:hypothetical protein